MGSGPRSELPLHPLINERFSPRAFSDRPITREELELLLEAARWAPSSMNEQPWRFIIALKGEASHELMLQAMNTGNRIWAEKAPLIVLNLVRRSLERNGIGNPHAWHDLGLALAQMNFQASAMGIGVRHIAGIDPKEARILFEVPEEFDVVSMMVLGYPGDLEALPENLKERELKRSPRKPIGDFVFAGKFGMSFG
jgi:nitroreductase